MKNAASANTQQFSPVKLGVTLTGLNI